MRKTRARRETGPLLGGGAPFWTAHLCVYALIAGPVVHEMSGLILTSTILLGLGLIWASAVDMKAFIIPDAASLGLVLAGLIATWQIGQADPVMHGLAASLAAGCLAGIDALYRRFRGHDGLGLGDVKLVAAAGAWLGPEQLAPMLLLACLTACAVIVIMALALAKRLRGTTGIAFGPFLAIALWITWLWGPMLRVV